MALTSTPNSVRAAAQAAEFSAPGDDGYVRAARDALAFGRAALRDKDRHGALRWFRRAQRLAPSDHLTRYLSAMATAAVEPKRAIALLEDLVLTAPSDRDARVALVALHYHCGQFSNATRALDHLLCNFTLPRGLEFEMLAARVAASGGCAGWIGIRGDGTYLCRAPHALMRLGMRRRFRPSHCEGAVLPSVWRKSEVLLTNSAAGRVLGAVINIAQLRRVEGVVHFDSALGVHGWVRAPFDPDNVPVVQLLAGTARVPFATSSAGDTTQTKRVGNGEHPVRAFCFPGLAMPTNCEVHVRVRGGTPMIGSPLRVGLEAKAALEAASILDEAWRPLPTSLISILPPVSRAATSRGRLDIILYAASASFVGARLDALIRQCHSDARVIVASDGNDGQLASLVVPKQIACRVSFQDWHRDAVGALNAVCDRAGERDILIIIGDVTLPPGGVQRLTDAAYDCPDVGTASPLAPDKGIANLGLPAHLSANPATLTAYDDALRAANAGLRIAIPHATSSCTYIKYECRKKTGPLRRLPIENLSASIEDFCRRAAWHGWRHVAACDVLVASERRAARAAAMSSEDGQNAEALERLHPGISSWLAAFHQTDALRPARDALAMELWRRGRAGRATILITHALGGGVERHVATRADVLRAAGTRPIIVRPGNTYSVSDGPAPAHPTFCFDTVESLAAFLAADNPCDVEIHHLAYHAPGLERLPLLLRIPYDVIVHDYASICPRVTLCGGANGYCGEPADTRDCDDCIADHGARIPYPGSAKGSVAASRVANTALFAAARAVIVPSQDTARRLRRTMPYVQTFVAPWQDDTALPAPILGRARRDELHVAICGGIGIDKGYLVLLACARDAERRGLALKFTVVGTTMDDERLMETDRVFVTGPYSEGEQAVLLREIGADIGFMPSVWPETWCYSLSCMWEAGLHVVAFNLGSQAERINRRGGGTLLPLGLPAAKVNDLLLSLVQQREESPLGITPPHAPSILGPLSHVSA